MTRQEVIRTIDETGGHTPFILTFCKSDGKLRDMVCIKRNKSKTSRGTARAGTNFKYKLNEKGVILIDELDGFPMKSKTTHIGTHIQLEQTPDIYNITVSQHRKKPKSIKLYSLIKFNGQPISHG